MTTVQGGYTGGGTKPKLPSELRSPVLRSVGAGVAGACAERLCATWPGLIERYGERGRRLTAEDNLWHLNLLDVAVVMDDPGYFERYADWLVRFLVPRGLTPEQIAGAFGFLADGLDCADCPAEDEAHRRALVDLLRLTEARVLSQGRGSNGVGAAPGARPPPS